MTGRIRESVAGRAIVVALTAHLTALISQGATIQYVGDDSPFGPTDVEVTFDGAAGGVPAPYVEGGASFTRISNTTGLPETTFTGPIAELTKRTLLVVFPYDVTRVGFTDRSLPGNKIEIFSDDAALQSIGTLEVPMYESHFLYGDLNGLPFTEGVLEFRGYVSDTPFRSALISNTVLPGATFHMHDLIFGTSTAVPAPTSAFALLGACVMIFLRRRSRGLSLRES